MITEILYTLQMSAGRSLSPGERWKAARWFNENVFEGDGFVLLCGIALIILIGLFLVVTYFRSYKQRKKTNRLFIEYADKRGLNARERHVLMKIALGARLRSIESIFTMGDVYDRGATQMVRVILAKHGSKRSNYLKRELSILREKLGFPKRNSVTDLALRPGLPNSRQIPIGKKLYLTSIETSEFFEVEAEVIDNNELELMLRVTQPLNCESGDMLCARYYLGAPVWEFDTNVLRIINNICVLQHSENIRYINRRRFLRVDVNEPAYIAAFPFARDFHEQKNIGNDEESYISELWGPPEFVRADVTELAGPGLRIIAPLEVKIGDRVVVILKLSTTDFGFREQSNEIVNQKEKPSRIIESIGFVKHAQAVEEGLSIAVELTGLNESNISELVKATNEASIKSRNRIINIPSQKKENSQKWEYISETVIG